MKHQKESEKQIIVVWMQTHSTRFILLLLVISYCKLLRYGPKIKQNNLRDPSIIKPEQ